LKELDNAYSDSSANVHFDAGTGRFVEHPNVHQKQQLHKRSKPCLLLDENLPIKIDIHTTHSVRSKPPGERLNINPNRNSIQSRLHPIFPLVGRQISDGTVSFRSAKQDVGRNTFGKKDRLLFYDENRLSFAGGKNSGRQMNNFDILQSADSCNNRRAGACTLNSRPNTSRGRLGDELQSTYSGRMFRPGTIEANMVRIDRYGRQPVRSMSKASANITEFNNRLFSTIRNRPSSMLLR